MLLYFVLSLSPGGLLSAYGRGDGRDPGEKGCGGELGG